jgi:hypothetical protein
MSFGNFDGDGPEVSQPDDPVGWSLKVSRAPPASGGLPQVCASMLVETSVPPLWESFEWNFVARLDNYAAKGENTALTVLANQWGSGPTWAMQVVAENRTQSDTGILYGIELDLCSPGLDPDNHRQALAIFYGDAYPNTFNPVGPTVRSYAGLTINPFMGMDRASLGYGVEMGGHVNEGIGSAAVGETLVSAYGSYSRAVLWTAGTTNSPIALRMGPGQTLAFSSGAGNGKDGIWYSGAFAPFFVGALAIIIDGQDTGLFLPVCNNHP